MPSAISFRPLIVTNRIILNESAVTADRIFLSSVVTFLRASWYTTALFPSILRFVRLYFTELLSPPLRMHSRADIFMAFLAGIIAEKMTVPTETTTDMSNAVSEKSKERSKLTRLIMDRTSTFSSSV